jgi:hypothetical protein
MLFFYINFKLCIVYLFEVFLFEVFLLEPTLCILRQNARLVPFATLHPRTFLHLLGFSTRFPLHRLLEAIIYNAKYLNFIFVTIHFLTQIGTTLVITITVITHVTTLTITTLTVTIIVTTILMLT